MYYIWKSKTHMIVDLSAAALIVGGYLLWNYYENKRYYTSFPTI